MIIRYVLLKKSKTTFKILCKKREKKFYIFNNLITNKEAKIVLYDSHLIIKISLLRKISKKLIVDYSVFL